MMFLRQFSPARAMRGTIMHGHYHFDCEEYCEDCLPVDANSPKVDLDTGEQDSPAHCSVCHKPLDYSLTGDGVTYVCEAIRESIREGKACRWTIHDCYIGTYYAGSPHCQIVRDWAKELQWYGLSGFQKILVSEFLALLDREEKTLLRNTK